MRRRWRGAAPSARAAGFGRRRESQIDIRSRCFAAWPRALWASPAAAFLLLRDAAGKARFSSRARRARAQIGDADVAFAPPPIPRCSLLDAAAASICR